MKKVILTILLLVAFNSFSQSKTTYTIIGKEFCSSDDEIQWICNKENIDYSTIIVEFGNSGEYELGMISFTDVKTKKILDFSIYNQSDETEFTTNPYGNVETRFIIDKEKKTITIFAPYQKEVYKFK